MLTVRVYRGVEYTTMQTADGRSKWICYPEGLLNGRREGTVAGSDIDAAAACRAAIDALLGPDLPKDNPGADIVSAA